MSVLTRPLTFHTFLLSSIYLRMRGRESETERERERERERDRERERERERDLRPFSNINTYYLPDNDICIIDRPNCCTKSTEERLLSKTKEIFKNRIFLVLNELLGKIDKDNKVKLRKFCRQTRTIKSNSVSFVDRQGK